MSGLTDTRMGSNQLGTRMSLRVGFVVFMTDASASSCLEAMGAFAQICILPDGPACPS